jgi:DNA-directed RNA polymerase specialized sigma24 family protein
MDVGRLGTLWEAYLFSAMWLRLGLGLHPLLAQLTRRQREAMTAFYGERTPLKLVATRMGISKRAVLYLLANGRRRLSQSGAPLEHLQAA